MNIAYGDSRAHLVQERAEPVKRAREIHLQRMHPCIPMSDGAPRPLHPGLHVSRIAEVEVGMKQRLDIPPIQLLQYGEPFLVLRLGAGEIAVADQCLASLLRAEAEGTVHVRQQCEFSVGVWANATEVDDAKSAIAKKDVVAWMRIGIVTPAGIVKPERSGVELRA